MSTSVFRPSAIQRHSQARAEQALPRLPAPPVTRCLSALLLILLIGLLAGVRTRMPVYVEGRAVVVPWHRAARLVAFFPPSASRRVRSDRPLRLLAGAGVGPSTAAILSVGVRAASAEEAVRDYGSIVGGIAASAGPSVLVLASWEGAPFALGSVCRVEAEIGSQSLLSLLPAGFSRPGGSR
jgi:hypothetical protein